jgi:hypothetical protein
MATAFGKKLTTALGLAAISISAFSATPALARKHHHDYRPGDYYRGYDRGYDRGYGWNGYDRGYRDRGYRHNSRYYDRYGYERCRDEGKGGAVIGAVAGGLLGNQVAGRGDRTTGTVIGAAIGAVAGHAIDKGDGRRC